MNPEESVKEGQVGNEGQVGKGMDLEGLKG